MLNRLSNKVKTIVVVGLVMLCLFTSIASLWRSSHTYNRLGVVDIETLIKERSITLAKNNPTGGVSAQKLQIVVDNLKAHLKEVAQLNDVILLNKNTTFAELPDYTDVVRESLNANR